MSGFAGHQEEQAVGEPNAVLPSILRLYLGNALQGGKRGSQKVRGEGALAGVAWTSAFSSKCQRPGAQRKGSVTPFPPTEHTKHAALPIHPLNASLAQPSPALPSPACPVSAPTHPPAHLLQLLLRAVAEGGPELVSHHTQPGGLGKSGMIVVGVHLSGAGWGRVGESRG